MRGRFAAPRPRCAREKQSWRITGAISYALVFKPLARRPAGTSKREFTKLKTLQTIEHRSFRAAFFAARRAAESRRHRRRRRRRAIFDPRR